MTIRKKKSLNVAKWLAQPILCDDGQAAKQAAYVTEIQKKLKEAVAEAAASSKFKRWKRVPAKTKKLKLIGQDSTKVITHFTANHLAIVWGLARDTIRDLFENEQGVEKLGNPDPKYKRQYASLRIPSDVAERVHRKLSTLLTPTR